MQTTLPVVVVEGIGFSGPLNYDEAVTFFGNWTGVYLVARASDGVAIDVGSAGDVGDRLANHDRKVCWNLNSLGHGLSFYAHLESDELRRRFKEGNLRQRLQPFCGVR